MGGKGGKDGKDGRKQVALLPYIRVLGIRGGAVIQGYLIPYRRCREDEMVDGEGRGGGESRTKKEKTGRLGGLLNQAERMKKSF